ncbi:MAG TPA: hypothetical protein VIW92_06995, partial [Thermoanaerobaculia bacterium]
MVTKRSPRSRTKSSSGRENGGGSPDEPLDTSPEPDPQGELTGRYIVTFRAGAQREAVAMMSRSAGISAVASSADWEGGAMDAEEAGTAEAVYFDKLDVCVVSTPPDQLNALSLAAADEQDGAIVAIEPERYMYVAS